jgi:hypothetical protein
MNFYVPALIMVTISAAYFWLGKRETDLRTRVFVSLHGLSAALLYFGALVLWEVTQAYRPWAVWPFLLLHLIPVASIIYSLFRFSGPKLLHLTQVANIACMAQTIFIGGMAVTGDWL